jgi:hypothetical protein
MKLLGSETRDSEGEEMMMMPLERVKREREWDS